MVAALAMGSSDGGVAAETVALVRVGRPELGSHLLYDAVQLQRPLPGSCDSGWSGGRAEHQCYAQRGDTEAL